MDINHSMTTLSNTRMTAFASLKQQQCVLNMQIRMAMENHNVDAQKKLEKELEQILEQINIFV
ncbi:hypothetical protein [Sporofaciens musculi]|uniref:hypothetical protein n=1 Tax=Sporofaciens musculi TaxID=2681861 RepID=UPI002570864B|nr:hypothetical protein [Sporofaciens musculi]